MLATVSSNGIRIPFDERHFAPMLDSSGIADDPASLRARYRADGYLYLRRLLDPEEVLAMRAAYFSQFDPIYLKQGTGPAEGIFSGSRPPGLPPHGVPGHPAYDFVRSETFLRFASQPVLASLAEILLEGPVLLLPRMIVRHFDSSTPRASRAHLDHTYLDKGSDHLVTMWVPLGDCPLDTGGLVYLEGSHLLDPRELEPLKAVTDRPNDPRPISHDLSWVARTLSRRWLWADFAAGDVTVHSPHLVHASLDTLSERMRLSADIRFLKQGEQPDPRWLVPWSGDDGN